MYRDWCSVASRCWTVSSLIGRIWGIVRPCRSCRRQITAYRSIDGVWLCWPDRVSLSPCLQPHTRNGPPGQPRWRTVRDALQETITSSPLTLQEARRRGLATQANWHVVRTLSAQNRLRIRHAQAGRNWSSIPEELRPPCHRDGYAGFSNVYGRMAWDAVAPTITGGCTTLSKGRFGHPDEDRTLSVREAALLQTFPLDYKIATPYMEYACNIIGNALPCMFAEAVARQCRKFLQTQAHKRGRGRSVPRPAAA